MTRDGKDKKKRKDKDGEGKHGKHALDKKMRDKARAAGKQDGPATHFDLTAGSVSAADLRPKTPVLPSIVPNPSLRFGGLDLTPAADTGAPTRTPLRAAAVSRGVGYVPMPPPPFRDPASLEEPCPEEEGVFRMTGGQSTRISPDNGATPHIVDGAGDAVRRDDDTVLHIPFTSDDAAVPVTAGAMGDAAPASDVPVESVTPSTPPPSDASTGAAPSTVAGPTMAGPDAAPPMVVEPATAPRRTLGQRLRHKTTGVMICVLIALCGLLLMIASSAPVAVTAEDAAPVAVQLP